MASRNSASLLPKAAYRLVDAIPIAAVRSVRDAPSYPLSQNTSMARMRAPSLSKLLGRPRSTMMVNVYRSIHKRIDSRVGHNHIMYRLLQKGFSHDPAYRKTRL